MTTTYELPNDLQLSELAVDAVEHGQVVYLTRGDERVAALVPPEVAASAEAVSRLVEDQIDLALMREARESGPSIPWEQARKELDLA